MNELNNPHSMTSREIAELTGKQHAHVCRDIRSMLIDVHGADQLSEIIPEKYRNRHSEYIREHSQEIVTALFGDDPKLYHIDYRGFSWTLDARGYVSEYILNKDHTLTLLTGYDVNARMRIIKRWQELEAAAAQANQPQHHLPQTYLEALKELVVVTEQKELLEAQIEADRPKVDFHDEVALQLRIAA